MFPLSKLLRNWKIEEDNCGLSEWDEVTDIPTCIDVELVSKINSDYSIIIAISTETWQIREVSFWCRDETWGHRLIMATYKNLDQVIEQWELECRKEKK